MFFFLFFMQFIWASSYVAQKLALADMPVGLALIFRYGFAVLLFFLLGLFKTRKKFTLKTWGLVALLGVINFSGSPFFQLTSLTYTSATDTAILIAFEPLITALLAVLFLKEKLTLSTKITFFVATAGVLIMSGWHGSQTTTSQWIRLGGDLLFLCSLLCEATCSTFAKKLTQEYDPFQLIAWMTLFGFLGDLLLNWPLLTPTNLNAITMKGWGAVVYLSIFASVIGYCSWFYLLKKLPLNQLALSLFLQPIIGTFLAVAILKEKVELQTVIGALVIFSTLLIWLYKKLAVSIDRKSDRRKKKKIENAKNLENPIVG